MTTTDNVGTDPSDPVLETLRLAQRLGFFGPGPIEHAISHARGFVDAIGPLEPGTRLVDIGSGGGLPGLVVATAFPQIEVVLIDRRGKRTDFLERAVQRLGLGHVSVWCRDVTDVVREVAAGGTEPFSVVTARGFGPPENTLRLAVGLLGDDPGTVLISEPPTDDRWSPALLRELAVVARRIGPVRRFDRVAPS